MFNPTTKDVRVPTLKEVSFFQSNPNQLPIYHISKMKGKREYQKKKEAIIVDQLED